MGHFCFGCDEKLVGGIVPTTCSCIECFCNQCWNNLFKDTFEEFGIGYDYNGDVIDETLYHKVPNIPDCEICGEMFVQNQYKHHGR